MTNRSFWKTMRPFLTNKEIISGNKISFFEEEKSVSNEFIVEEILNISYINVAEISPGIRPTSILDQENTNLLKAIDIVVEKYNSHLSIIKIKKNFKDFNPFLFQKVFNTHVYTLLNNINANKAMVFDLNLPKLVKIAANKLSESLTCIIYYSRYPSKQIRRSFRYTS